MTTQPEAILEANLVQQLAGQGYERVQVNSSADLLTNLQAQLGAFNKTAFSDPEFQAILNHLEKGSIFEKARTLRGRFQLTRDNGDIEWIRFFDSENTSNNLFQVTNQVVQDGSYLNRYDVTILVNGLPLVHTELKSRGIEMKEAFNQILRYLRHSFWSNYALFQYAQIFMISNGVNTKYFVNNPIPALNYKQTFFWADKNNRNINELSAFTSTFLDKEHLGKMISNYIVRNETYKVLMVMRPYQFYAVEAIIDKVKKNRNPDLVDNTSDEQVQKNGYIWHTTGSGKTLTSFKASQIIMNLPEVNKVVFVVDRKDLDYQTMNEFNAFKKDSVDVTDNTKTLVNQFRDDNSPLILTTIQKLNNAISPGRHYASMEKLKDKNIVFIFDECHRSQFGKTHERITSFFANAQLFGFTGTPIFADNAAKNDLGKRTTKDLFGICLHKYTIQDAIRDENVLKFSIEYVGRYKKKGNTFIDIEVEDIDRKEVLDSPERLGKIADYVIRYHNTKTHKKDYSALFAVSSIENLIKYYEIFKTKKEAGEHDLRIAAIFSYGANTDDAEAMGLLPEFIDLSPEYETTNKAAEPEPTYATKHEREKLDDFMADYNAMYKTAFSTKDPKQFEGYFKDISKRLKEREKERFKDKDRLDILLVVNMMLTGFDAKKVNTLYVDKNLRYHGLIQAFSRTNRIINEQKSQGNIVCFRNLKKSVDEAIMLFSDKEAKEDILLPEYNEIVEKFVDAYVDLIKLTPTVSSVDSLPSEDEELAFVQAFRKLIRIKNVLNSFLEFTWDDLPMEEQTFVDYQSKYLDLHDKVRRNNQVQKASILEEIDFELELIHRDEINVAYILKLVKNLKEEKNATAAEKQKKAIEDYLSGEVALRSKRELIEKFIDENLPKITDPSTIQDEFEKYWEEQKVLALGKICEEEGLDKQQFKALIETYIFSEQEPLRDDVFKCLANRPSILKAREIGDRIIERMKEYVEVFFRGMVG